VVIYGLQDDLYTAWNICVAGNSKDVLPNCWKIGPNSFYATMCLLHTSCNCWYILFSCTLCGQTLEIR